MMDWNELESRLVQLQLVIVATALHCQKKNRKKCEIIQASCVTQITQALHTIYFRNHK